MSDLKLKKYRKPGSAEDVRLIQWRAVKSAEAALYHAADVPEVLRCVHAITQAAAGYIKVVESAELEERIEAIEAVLRARKNGRPAATA